jgi:acetolactate decarboxylase
VAPVAADTGTPFAVVVPCTPDTVSDLEGPADDAALHALLARLSPPAAGAAAIRLDGGFDRVRARSVPRQSPPCRPLAEVAADQAEFTFAGLAGTVVGFRFPVVADGIEVAGVHLHFVSADRRRSGHVLSCDVRSGRLAIAAVTALRVELRPGVRLPARGAPSRAEEVRRLEAD